MDLDLDHYRTWIGREETASELVTPELVRRFDATLDLGSDDRRPGEPVAIMIHHCLAQEVIPTAELGADGHAVRGGFLPPVPLPRRMWAGGEITFGPAICVGDRVQRTSSIEDVSIKQGRSGIMCFVTVDHVFRVEDRVVVRERQDIVYRGKEDASGSAQGSKPAETGEHRRSIAVSTPLLFRYSAMLFNAHRIHYDRPFTTDEEGYPGLIVHGPLQATLLAHFAASLRGGQTPRQFAFRSHAPLFDDTDFELHARQDGEKLHLWTARPGGPVAMTAEASW